MSLNVICDSQSSPRDGKGKLVLRANPHRFVRQTLADFVDNTDGFLFLGGVNNVEYPRPFDDSVYNKAYGNFTRKLHSSDASLGVTLASWKQSEAMITKRLRQATNYLTGIKSKTAAREMVRDFNASKGRPLKTVANTHLEGTFGWQPLFEDIYNAGVVVANPVPPVFVKAGARGFFQEKFTTREDFYFNRNIEKEYQLRCRLGAIASIDNPNLWLLNRLGLINPAVVAFDLIPWSFVVGMFANINQILKSYTDFVGINLTDYSMTNTLVGTHLENIGSRPHAPPSYLSLTTSRKVVYKFKNRSVGGSPLRPSFEFKVPELSWGTAMMFASLAVQQSTRVLRLLT